jgi:cell division septum initiation protein DivIVA
MSDQFDLLTQKIDQAASAIERLSTENLQLRQQLSRLKTELTEVRKERDQIAAGNRDDADTVRSKLTLVLSRLEQLEELTK